MPLLSLLILKTSKVPIVFLMLPALHMCDYFNDNMGPSDQRLLKKAGKNECSHVQLVPWKKFGVFTDFYNLVLQPTVRQFFLKLLMTRKYNKSGSLITKLFITNKGLMYVFKSIS